MSVTDLTVILRTCVHREAHGNPRFCAIPKRDLLFGCVSSLLRSCRQAKLAFSERTLKLVVVDDHSDPRSQRELQALLASSGLHWDWTEVSGSGNGDSLRTCYEYARRSPSPLTYFVEDDYLHFENCVTEMLATYGLLRSQLSRDPVILPYDCPDRYHPTRLEPAIIAMGSDRHWRSVFHSSGSFMVNHETLIEHWPTYMEFTLLDKLPQHYEADTINRIYKQVPCFSPVPSLALHMGDHGSESPFVDWRALWSSVSSSH